MALQPETVADECLVDIGDETATITIQGKEYLLKPLNLGGMCAGERHIRDMRMNRFLHRAEVGPMTDALVAKSIAEIECQTVTLGDLLDSFEGRCYLLYLAMHRADNSVTLVYVMDEMPAMAARMLTQVMYVISGLSRAASTQEKESPLASSSDRPLTSADRNDGRSNSAISASS